MTGPSSTARGEHTPRPGVAWERQLVRTETVIDDDAPDPRPNRKTRRAMQRTEEPMTEDLTAEEARDLADDLGLKLYRAQDALAFVEECCVIADRAGRTVTTADVRGWLRGAQCGRQLAATQATETDKTTRVIALYERWVAAGPPPLGTSVSRWWDARLAELHAAIRPPTDQPTEA